MSPRHVHALDRSGRDDHAKRLSDRHEVERVAQPLERCVPRAVVDDDDLVLGIAEREQRVHAVDDRRLLVVRGDEHRHRRCHRGGEHRVVGGVATGAPMVREAAPRHSGEREVDEVERGEVDEREGREREPEIDLDAEPRRQRRRRGLDRAHLTCHHGKRLLHGLEFAERAAELLARVDMVDRQGERLPHRASHQADRRGGVQGRIDIAQSRQDQRRDG